MFKLCLVKYALFLLTYNFDLLKVRNSNFPTELVLMLLLFIEFFDS
jgi:hypothetical protein